MAQREISISCSPGSAWGTEAEPWGCWDGSEASCLAGSQGWFSHWGRCGWALSRGGAPGTTALPGNPCPAPLACDPTQGWQSSGWSRTWHTKGGTVLSWAPALPSLLQQLQLSGQSSSFRAAVNQKGSLSFCCLQLKLERVCLGQVLAIGFTWEPAMAWCWCICLVVPARFTVSRVSCVRQL